MLVSERKNGKREMCIRDRYCDRVVELFTLREREINLYDVIRSYEELRERLKFEKIDDMKDLPCAVHVDDYFDDPTVDDEHLPCDVVDIVDEYDEMTYMGITNNIKGDWTKITNADKVYEIIIRNNPIDYYGICLLYTSRCV